MKRIFTLLTVLLCANIGLAQEEESVPDTTRFKIGSTEFIIIENDTMRIEDNENSEDFDEDEKESKVGAYWAGIDVGVGVLMNNQFEPSFTEPHLLTDPASSFSYSLNFFEHFIKFGTPHVGLVVGAGFTNARFGFKDSYMRLHANADSTYGMADSSLVSGFSQNQLRVNYFNIPIMFQINTSKNKKKNLHLAFGIIGGVRINSKMRYKFETTEGEAKDKRKGRYNVNPFQASLTARLGYRNIGVFAAFNMLPLFENDKSRVAKPLTFGASFHF